MISKYEWCPKVLNRDSWMAGWVYRIVKCPDQSWVFFGRTDAEAETPIFWPPHAKSWLIGKDSDAGRDWGQEEKGTTGDEMAGWHHRLNGHESRWTPEVGDGQGGLACCDSWGRKDSDTTEQLNWTAMLHITIISQSHFHFKVNRDTFHENPLFFLERLQCLRKHNKY